MSAPDDFDEETPTRPAVVFDPERHLEHARICPACSSLLRRCGTLWECASATCPVSVTDEQMAALLGRPTRKIEAP